MSMHENCIFCKIVNGDIPAAKVFENEHVLAFLDISQVSKGHTLVIPKLHQENIFELKPETAKELFSVVPKISNAIKEAYQPLGLNILNNNGEIAGQTVFHYHLHLIPRYGKGDGFGAVWHDHSSQYKKEDLQEIASEISSSIK
ncbi:HIT family protein [Anaerobacillus alkalidiazotrophicus]|uniref:HIT family protein n=1 Tax=Anaerobacillus alkalidiazotrophicus TaxID=472963 RepID=A0A1S2MA44_9BACI|nr:HIT family protein [Anaerobacillus alkalidiazotrophicus]OIJ21363.1 HIT family protein [Anaerobacillus alkalidiazotrophicus]